MLAQMCSRIKFPKISPGRYQELHSAGKFRWPQARIHQLSLNPFKRSLGWPTKMQQPVRRILRKFLRFWTSPRPSSSTYCFEYVAYYLTSLSTFEFGTGLMRRNVAASTDNEVFGIIEGDLDYETVSLLMYNSMLEVLAWRKWSTSSNLQYK